MGGRIGVSGQNKQVKNLETEKTQILTAQMSLIPLLFETERGLHQDKVTAENHVPEPRWPVQQGTAHSRHSVPHCRMNSVSESSVVVTA